MSELLLRTLMDTRTFFDCIGQEQALRKTKTHVEVAQKRQGTKNVA